MYVTEVLMSYQNKNKYFHKYYVCDGGMNGYSYEPQICDTPSLYQINLIANILIICQLN